MIRDRRRMLYKLPTTARSVWKPPALFPAGRSWGGRGRKYCLGPSVAALAYSTSLVVQFLYVQDFCRLCNLDFLDSHWIARFCGLRSSDSRNLDSRVDCRWWECPAKIVSRDFLEKKTNDLRGNSHSSQLDITFGDRRSSEGRLIHLLDTTPT